MLMIKLFYLASMGRIYYYITELLHPPGSRVLLLKLTHGCHDSFGLVGCV